MSDKDKAAPVGEREAASNWYDANDPEKVRPIMKIDWPFIHSLVIGAFQAGAAYQRDQQPTDWQPSGADYDRSIHMNPDAKAWADFFVATFPGLADKHDLMLGWFANAMMAMHDYLKAQQPQSAEAVAFYWQDVGYKNPNRHGPYFGRPTEAALRNVAGGAIPVLLYTTPQPSAGVVMPERQSPEDEWHYVMRERSHGWNACLDEFARLNGKE